MLLIEESLISYYDFPVAHLSASLTMKIESTAASTEMTASVWAVPARFCFCGHCLHNYTTLLAMPHCSLQIFKRSKYSRNIINVSPIPSLRFLTSQLLKWSHWLSPRCHRKKAHKLLNFLICGKSEEYVFLETNRVTLCSVHASPGWPGSPCGSSLSRSDGLTLAVCLQTDNANAKQ